MHTYVCRARLEMRAVSAEINTAFAYFLTVPLPINGARVTTVHRYVEVSISLLGTGRDGRKEEKKNEEECRKEHGHTSGKRAQTTEREKEKCGKMFNCQLIWVGVDCPSI